MTEEQIIISNKRFKDLISINQYDSGQYDVVGASVQKWVAKPSTERKTMNDESNSINCFVLKRECDDGERLQENFKLVKNRDLLD